VTLAEGACSEVAAQVARLRSLEGGVRAFGDVVSLGQAAIRPLEELLREPATPICQPRCLAADALAAIGGELGLEALLRALADSLERELSPVLHEAETAVINSIAENLGRLGGGRAADGLLEALRRRPLPEVARSLGRLGEERAIPALVRCLQDDVAREAAVEALRQIGRPALPFLQRTLLQPQLAHGFEGATWIAGRAAAANLLGVIGGRDCLLPLLWASSRRAEKAQP
jgi:HEAT repeat protein